MPVGIRNAPSFFRQLSSLLLLATMSLAGAAAWADPPGRVGRVAEAQGPVWMFDAEQGEWTAAGRNRPVTTGDRLSVERGARAELQIGSGTLRLDGGSDIEIDELSDDRVQVQLHSGSLALRLRSNESARDFAVSTADGRFEPQRAGHYRVDRQDDGSFGGVLAGVMRFEARDSTLEINAGQRAEFWNEGGVTHFSWSQIPNDRFADWVAQREQLVQQQARARYVSPEMTGAEDLDRYGDWDRHPEYGPIWFPRGVEPGWAPYRNGYWAYVQPWGYTWVDDAPWGFAPFHYGRWLWWHDRWAWCPGQYVARPVYAPALVAWIGGSNFGVGINIGGGPAVGWVPLSPREVYQPTYRVTNVYITNINTPHEHWRAPQRPDGSARAGPVTYANQAVAGGVTVVSQDVLRERRPISKGVIAPVDARVISRWQAQPAPTANDSRGAHNAAPYVPPPPVARVTTPTSGIAAAGSAAPAIPPAPGAARDGGTHWGRDAQHPPLAAWPIPPAAAQRGRDEPPRASTPPVEPRGVAAQPVRPGPPPQPVQPAYPTQPTPSRQTIEPVRPVQPTPPVEPRGVVAQPVRPGPPPQPVQPAYPTQPTQPAQPTPSRQTIEPMRPVQPTPPGQPAQAPRQAQPAQPAMPAAQPAPPVARGAPVAGQHAASAPRRPDGEERGEHRQAPAPESKHDPRRDAVQGQQP